MKESAKDGISIVLPVFNEADVIESTIRGICNYVSGRIKDVEVIVVNDGSKDNTGDILARMAQNFPVLKIVSHSTNQGYGAALRSGIAQSQKTWILLMDSDGQFHIDALGQFWPLRHEYELLLGSRQKRADVYYRLILGKLGNSLSNLFLGRNILDINCGFKLFKREHIQALSLASTGGINNFEVLYLFFKKFPSITVKQIPVPHYPRTKGASTGGNFKVIWRIVTEGAKIIFK